MSLIDAFAADGRFDVRVIGFPCDGDIGMPDRHEAVPYMRTQRGVRFEDVTQDAAAPFHARLLVRVARMLGDWRRGGWVEARALAWPLKAAHVAVLKVMRAVFMRPLPWLERVAATWNPAAIIVDEVYAQPGRSHMTDVVLPQMQARGVPVYMIQTGHNIYRSAEPGGKRPKYKPTAAQRFFMPSELDLTITRENFPQERHEVMGNLRMDAQWLQRLKGEILVLPYYPADDVLADLPRGRVKVAVMLSKMTYGVQAEALKDTIRMLAYDEDVALAIKPHTRGMKFDFMNPAEIRRAFVADGVPSALLCEWADIVLFTGSSVAYHAMLCGKAAGYLKYCQKLKTVFDGGESAVVFESAQALEAAIRTGAPVRDGAAVRAHLVQEVWAGDEMGATAQRHLWAILADLGMDRAAA